MTEQETFDAKWLNAVEKQYLFDWAMHHKHIEETRPFFDNTMQSIVNTIIEKGESPKDILNEYWDTRSTGVEPRSLW